MGALAARSEYLGPVIDGMRLLPRTGGLLVAPTDRKPACGRSTGNPRNSHTAPRWIGRITVGEFSRYRAYQAYQPRLWSGVSGSLGVVAVSARKRSGSGPSTGART